jgi:hypothetical protein
MYALIFEGSRSGTEASWLAQSTVSFRQDDKTAERQPLRRGRSVQNAELSLCLASRLQWWHHALTCLTGTRTSCTGRNTCHQPTLSRFTPILQPCLRRFTVIWGFQSDGVLRPVDLDVNTDVSGPPLQPWRWMQYIPSKCWHRPDDGGSTHLWNVALLQQDYTVLYLAAVRTWNLTPYTAPKPRRAASLIWMLFETVFKNKQVKLIRRF